MNNRIEWLDLSKGIAIILMVLGHTSLPDFLSRFIWAFHMPLFFIASGWTTNWMKYDLKGFASKKMQSLMVPFIVYSAIVLLIQIDVGWNSAETFFVNGWAGYALWFIPVLFMALICSKILYSIQRTSIRYIVLFLFVAVGYGLSFFKIHLPWTLSSVPYATLMLVLGSEMKKLPKRYLRPRWYSVLILLSLTIMISRFFRLDMCFNRIIPILPITIGAVSGTLFVFQLSMLCEKYFKSLAKVFISIGRETYIIVAFSQITIMLLNEYFHFNVALKYGLLVLVLVALKYMKVAINRLFNTKIL